MVRLTNDEFIDKFIASDNKNIEIIETYVNANTKILCKCLVCSNYFYGIPNDIIHKYKHGCKDCYRKWSGEHRKKSHEAFVDEMKNVNNDIVINGKYLNSRDKIECCCKIHDTVFYATPTKLLQGQTGCKQCISEKNHKSGLKPHNEFVEELYNINPEVEVIENYNGAKHPIKVKCKKCNTIWSPEASSLLSGYGCPVCNASKGERAIRLFLESHNIDYTPQKVFDDLKGIGGVALRFDFYIDDIDLLIEYQGQFHDGSSGLSTDAGYKRQNENDERKRTYVSINNHNLLEIWYWDFKNINTILQNKIYELKNPVETTA